MASLDSGFEADLRESILDDVEHTLVGGPNNLVYQAIQQSHDALRDYSGEYNVEPLIDSLQLVETSRTADGVTARWGWDHPAAPYFEFGTPDNYTIDGDPVLSFVWEDPPQWVQEEFEQEGDGYRVFFAEVDSGAGIDETRFTRWGLRWLRLQLGGTVTR